MIDNPLNSAMIRLLAARPADEFVGRKAELDRLFAVAQAGAGGVDCTLGLVGPHGAGKSELLRQLSLRLGRHAESCIPIYLDLPAFAMAEPQATPSGEGRMREALFRALLRQGLIGTGSISAGDLQWLESDPARLAGYCYGAGLGALAPFVAEAARHLSFVEAWRGLLGAWRGYGLPPLVLLLDGAAGSDDPAVTGMLTLILESARLEGCPVIFESPGESELALTRGAEMVERFTLKPLQPMDALRLTQRIGQKRGWTLPVYCFYPILERLGPWPGWVRAWAMRVRQAQGVNAVRLAEESYVDFLSSGPWAEALRRRFERLVPLTLREQALRLLGATLERDQLISPYEAPAMLGLGEQESERVLTELTRLGLLSRRGPRWGAPQSPALADWARLLVAEDGRDVSSAAVRMGLLGRLLTQPRPTPDAAPALPALDVPLTELLRRFNGQSLPPVLFHYGDYYEALGKLPPAKRRETVGRATASMRLPEVIGVAEWRPPSVGEQLTRICFGRAYREGKYQRSHEEVWIAIDLSAVKMLTTPEIQAAMRQAEALEATLRPNRFHRWLILGEGASAEALELVKTKGLLCSNREQLAIIHELMTQPAAQSGEASPAARVRDVTPSSPGTRHTVIELRSPEVEPRSEVSSLRLSAREGSELIAALAAEKIAIRSDFDPVQAGQVKTAVLEGVLNAIEHSLNAEKAIDVQFMLNAEALEVLIENEGPGFDPLAVPTPDPQAKLASAHKRGWGLSLMKRFMDEVGYEPCERGTRLRLVKRRRRRTTGAAEEVR